MRIVDVIERKRQGQPNSEHELEALVLGYLRGQVPDYQAAAWLMAVCFQGMVEDELAAFTQILARSGEQLDLSSVGRRVADKHSTGGVGDKTSLVVLPLVAACGVPIGKMSGRGLGFTGGTIDKLESIPGMRVELSAQEFLAHLRQVGIVISGQSADLAPADGKLYALRDVTATVASVPLIAASVMSKKLAGGAHCIVLDVKTGRGAFMQTAEMARELAQRMIAIGERAGRRMAALVTDMSQPLGQAVGNALEVREAISTLSGRGPSDLAELAMALATEMVALADGLSEDEARARVRAVLESGSALEAFGRLVRAQGGDVRVVEDDRLLPSASLQEQITSSRAGHVARADALVIAETANMLGAGRARKGDPIDPAVGIVVRVKIGDRVEADQPLATIHANKASLLNAAVERLRAAFEIGGEPVRPAPLIYAKLRGG